MPGTGINKTLRRNVNISRGYKEEVTSIGIEQQRVAGITFDIGIHMNLTPEHLEFHKTFEHYWNAKLKLFDQVKKPSSMPMKTG